MSGLCSIHQGHDPDCHLCTALERKAKERLVTRTSITTDNLALLRELAQAHISSHNYTANSPERRAVHAADAALNNPTTSPLDRQLNIYRGALNDIANGRDGIDFVREIARAALASADHTTKEPT